MAHVDSLTFLFQDPAIPRSQSRPRNIAGRDHSADGPRCWGFWGAEKDGVGGCFKKMNGTAPQKFNEKIPKKWPYLKPRLRHLFLLAHHFGYLC